MTDNDVDQEKPTDELREWARLNERWFTEDLREWWAALNAG